MDNLLHKTLKIVTGVVQSTPVPWLNILYNIAPPHLKRERTAHKLHKKCNEHPNLAEIPLRHDLLNPPSIRIKSRKLIWKDNVMQQGDYSIDDKWRR